MKSTPLMICCACILLSGCGNSGTREVSETNNLTAVEHGTDDLDKVYFIDFEQNLKSTPKDTFVVNNIAKSISFIPLETTSNSLLRDYFFQTAKIDDTYYVSSAIHSMFSGIMMFDSAGYFIDYLVQNGRGPNELANTNVWSCNGNTKQLVAFAFGYQMLLHSFDKNTTEKCGIATLHGCQLNDGNIVGLRSTYGIDNTDTPYLSFFDQEGEMIKSLYYRYSSKRDISSYLQENQGNVGDLESYGLYPSYAGNALFKDVFNDTIYLVRSIDEIRPYIVLNRGSLAPKVQNSTNREATAKTVIVKGIIETEKYFFIKYSYKDVRNSAIWNKQSGSLIANTVAVFSNENIPILNNNGFTKYRTPNGKEILVAISNYMDGKLYCVLKTAEAIEFLPDIKEDDNPVLMVIELK